MIILMLTLVQVGCTQVNHQASLWEIRESLTQLVELEMAALLPLENLPKFDHHFQKFKEKPPPTRPQHALNPTNHVKNTLVDHKLQKSKVDLQTCKGSRAPTTQKFTKNQKRLQKSQNNYMWNKTKIPCNPQNFNPNKTSTKEICSVKL